MDSVGSIKHLFSVDDLTPDSIVAILDRAESLRTAKGVTPCLPGKIAGLCFFEQSTRTRIGFDAAMNLLGGSTWSIGDPRAVPRTPFTETVEDTVRVVSAYCHVIILRCEETNTAERAMHASVVPVINAGSGTQHHPTQSLIDLFQIQKRLGQLTGLRIGVVGDLPTSRAARSLVKALRHWPPTELRLMSPPGRLLSQEDLDGLDASTISTFDCINPENLDVLYIAGLPNPKGSPPFSSEIRRNLTIAADTLGTMPEHCIVMCPLPRIDEIHTSVDGLANAAYFQQSDDGLWIRMAVLLRTLL
jgi:aspartate carbamoyltransferase catalytic subunit